jgi:tetratricopeptide (TPR) repeat protein/class 3 adenylate cyclase/TolB-like protein
MANELNLTGAQPDAPETASGIPFDRLELAHVLFMDLVSFSTMPMEEQLQTLGELQKIVRNTQQVREGERDKRLICLPTGDGMALVFFGDLIACVECALVISAEIKISQLRLRMGINTGPVYRVADINTSLNVAGGGINAAQRVMDAGDAGHILVSKSTADILQQLKNWAPHLHDLGEHAVKHGVQVHFYNLWTLEAGNPAMPARFQTEGTRTSTRLRRRRILAATAGLIAVVLGFTVAKQFIVKRRSSVAVIGFRNITSRPEVDWVSTGLADGLRTELASAGKMRTISGEETAEMWKDLGLRLDSMGKTSLSRLHSRGADIVIVGSYTDQEGGRIHVNMDIQDTAAGETVGSLAVDGTEAAISQLIREAGQRLRTKMGLGEISPEKERQIALAQPSPEAAPFYSDGLARLRAYEPMQARSYLGRAAIIDSAFPYAHAALAEAWLILGYDQNAKVEAKKASELSANLSFEDQTSIEGRYRAISTNWPAAITAYQQLYKFSPQNVDYGLKLAEVQRSAGKGQDAIRTLATLRKLPKPEGSDPRIDLEEAETAASIGNLKRGLAAAATAAAKAKDTGARLLESRSLTWSCVAHRRLGEIAQAKLACEEARKIAAELGDKLGTARALNNLANILKRQGDPDGAKRLYEQALALGREIGAQRDVSGALNNLGIILSGQGELALAKQRYGEALKIQQEIGFKAEMPNTLENIGDLLHQQGDLAGAQRTFAKAIAVAQESGNEQAQVGSKANLATVLFERGDLNGAEKYCREAIAMERKFGAKSDLATMLDFLGDLMVARGNLQEAEQSYREAISIQEGLGEKGSLATSKTGLATVFLERGQASEAEAAVIPCVEEFRSEKDFPDEVFARVVLAQSLMAEKKLTQAQEEVNQALALAGKTSQKNVQYRAVTTSALLAAELGGESNGAKAIQGAQKVANDAAKSGMPGFHLEARLAIGKIELANGKSAMARNELRMVQQEAEAKGFLLIAQKAARLDHESALH